MNNMLHDSDSEYEDEPKSWISIKSLKKYLNFNDTTASSPSRMCLSFEQSSKLLHQLEKQSMTTRGSTQEDSTPTEKHKKKLPLLLLPSDDEDEKYLKAKSPESGPYSEHKDLLQKHQPHLVEDIPFEYEKKETMGTGSSKIVSTKEAEEYQFEEEQSMEAELRSLNSDEICNFLNSHGREYGQFFLQLEKLRKSSEFPQFTNTQSTNRGDSNRKVSSILDNSKLSTSSPLKELSNNLSSNNNDFSFNLLLNNSTSVHNSIVKQQNFHRRKASVVNGKGSENRSGHNRQKSENLTDSGRVTERNNWNEKAITTENTKLKLLYENELNAKKLLSKKVEYYERVFRDHNFEIPEDEEFMESQITARFNAIHVNEKDADESFQSANNHLMNTKEERKMFKKNSTLSIIEEEEKRISIIKQDFESRIQELKTKNTELAQKNIEMRKELNKSRREHEQALEAQAKKHEEYVKALIKDFEMKMNEKNEEMDIEINAVTQELEERFLEEKQALIEQYKSQCTYEEPATQTKGELAPEEAYNNTLQQIETLKLKHCREIEEIRNQSTSETEKWKSKFNSYKLSKQEEVDQLIHQLKECDKQYEQSLKTESLEREKRILALKYQMEEKDKEIERLTAVISQQPLLSRRKFVDRMKSPNDSIIDDIKSLENTATYLEYNTHESAQIPDNKQKIRVSRLNSYFENSQIHNAFSRVNQSSLYLMNEVPVRKGEYVHAEEDDENVVGEDSGILDESSVHTREINTSLINLKKDPKSLDNRIISIINQIDDYLQDPISPNSPNMDAQEQEEIDFYMGGGSNSFVKTRQQEHELQKTLSTLRHNLRSIMQNALN